MPEQVRKRRSWRLLPQATHAAAPPKPKYFSLIDVGADTIKVAVVGVQNGHVTVLGHGLETAHGHDVAGGRAEAAALAAIINGALHKAEDATDSIAGEKIVPDDALFILPARTLTGKLFTVEQTRPRHQAPISQKELDALWDRADRLAGQELPTLPDVGSDWIPHSVTPAGLYLDGHLVNDPLGMKGAVLQLSVYGVICQPAIIRAMTQLAERLELDIHSMVAAPQALTTIIPTHNALVLDVGWSGTDCFLIRNDTLVASGRSFMGGDFFTRSLARIFEHTPADAEALKLAYASPDVLSMDDTRIVKLALSDPLRRWGNLAVETIQKISNSDKLPGSVFFVGGGANLPGLKDELLECTRMRGLSFARTPEFRSLGEVSLRNFSHAPTGFSRGIVRAGVEFGKNDLIKKYQ